MARRWVNFVTESAYKTGSGTLFDNTTLGTKWLPIELSADDDWNPVWMPDREAVKTTLASAKTERHVGTTSSLTASLRTLLYPAQDDLLVGWGFNRINSGQTSPWTTTEPVGDCASAIFAWGITDDTNTLTKYRGDGFKVQSMEVAMSRSTLGGAAVLSAQLVGSQRIAAIGQDVEPTTLTYYPSTAPYHLTECALTVNGTVHQNYDSVTVGVENDLIVRKDNRTYAQPIRAFGRSVKIQVSKLFTISPDIEALYLSRNACSNCTLVMTHATSPTLTFDLKAQARITDYKRALPLSEVHGESYTVEAFFDRVATTDAVASFT